MTVPQTIKDLKARAEADEGYTIRCIYGEKVFYQQAEQAWLEGHIYSHAGMDEFKISRCCEFHFDQMFPEEEE